MTKNSEILKSVEKSFTVSVNDMRRIVGDFHSEMEKGLAGSKGSLRMIPTYVDRPTGGEKGVFLAIDLGGTNFRILELELKGGGRSSVPRIMKFALEEKYITGDQKAFFGFIARCLKVFLKRYDKEAKRTVRDLGFTFSFPVRQSGVASGALVCWTKGFNVKGVVDHDVVGLLNEALARNGMSNIRIAALANDTVGTLVAKSYEDGACDVGVILGTGTNACYSEYILNITKWADRVSTHSGRMIINIEWGNFDKLARTPFDKYLDKESSNPGEQMMEKMVSGKYLGELARLVMNKFIDRGALFNGKRPPALNSFMGLKTEHISAIEGDGTKDLLKAGRTLEGLGVFNSTREDRMLAGKVCGIVSTRGARISAAAVAAVVTKIDPNLLRRHTIAIDGSVYEKHPGFSRHMKDALRQLLGSKASMIRPALVKDGSGKGAAIIAAVASAK